MNKNFLKAIFEKFGGKSAPLILEILQKKKNVNEFIISKKLNMTVNQVRNILYKLASIGLVNFIKKKDKKKGWFIYYWNLEEKKCWERIEKETIEEISSLKEEIEKRKNQRFYYCKNCEVEINEESSLERNFICSECGETYELRDQEAIIGELMSKLNRKERDLMTIRKTIEQIKQVKRKKETKNKGRKK